MLRPQADLFGQFPKHGLLRRLIRADTTLGKLPGTLANPFRPEQTSLRITQDDANVGPISLRIDHVLTNSLK